MQIADSSSDIPLSKVGYRSFSVRKGQRFDEDALRGDDHG